LRTVSDKILAELIKEGGETLWSGQWSVTSDRICLHSSDTERKWEYNETLHQLFIDFKKAYDSVRRELLYNILIEFRVPIKLVRLIKMCLNDTYSKPV
jgi:hypothetical protein